MSSGSTTWLFYRDLGARWQHDDSRWRPKSEFERKASDPHDLHGAVSDPDLSGLERGGNAVASRPPGPAPVALAVWLGLTSFVRSLLTRVLATTLVYKY